MSRGGPVGNRNGLRAEICRNGHRRTTANTTVEAGRLVCLTCRRDVRLARYGIDSETFDAMLEAQGGACAICATSEPGGRGEWHVDHDHDTGARRGLLCHSCNVMLGHARSSAYILRSAAAYLAHYGVAA